MFGTYSRSTTVLGALHDKVVLTNAKLQWGDNSDLYIAILKATYQNEVPPKEKHVQLLKEEISKDMSNNRTQFIVRELLARLKSEEWLIVLKTLIVIQRLIKEADTSFYKQVVDEESVKMGLLRLENFNDKNQKDNFDFSAFVRAYGAYLDIRQEAFRDIEYDSTDHKTVPQLLNSDTPRKIQAIQLLNKYLLKIIACVPEGRAAKSKVVVDGAMVALIKDSLRVYSVVQKSLLTLMDQFFEMDAVDAKKCSLVFRKSVDIHEQLQKYYGRVMKLKMDDKSVSVPTLEKVPADFLLQMDDYVRSLQKNLHGEQTLSIKKKALVRQQSLQEATVNKTSANLQRTPTNDTFFDTAQNKKTKEQEAQKKLPGKKQRQKTDRKEIDLLDFDDPSETGNLYEQPHEKSEPAIPTISGNPFQNLSDHSQLKQNQSSKDFPIQPISGSRQKLLESTDDFTQVQKVANLTSASPEFESSKEQVQATAAGNVGNEQNDGNQKEGFFDPLLNAQNNDAKNIISDPLLIPGSQTKFGENNQSENPFINLPDQQDQVKNDSQKMYSQTLFDLLGDFEFQIQNEPVKQSLVKDPFFEFEPFQNSNYQNREIQTQNSNQKSHQIDPFESFLCEQSQNTNQRKREIQTQNSHQKSHQIDPFESFLFKQSNNQKSFPLESLQNADFDPFNLSQNFDSVNTLQKSKSQHLTLGQFENSLDSNNPIIFQNEPNKKQQLSVQIPLNPFTQQPVPIQPQTQSGVNNDQPKKVDNFDNFGIQLTQFVAEYQPQISPQTTTSLISPNSQIDSPKYTNQNQNDFFGAAQFGVCHSRKTKDPLEQLTEDLGYLMKPVEPQSPTINQLRQKSAF